MIHETTTVQHVTSQGVDVISKTAVKVSKHITHQYQVCDHHISPTVLPSAQTCRVPETNNVNLNKYFGLNIFYFKTKLDRVRQLDRVNTFQAMCRIYIYSY